MPNPFPGVDPYLESSGDWPDFHLRLITHCAEQLADHLPRHYRARAQEQIRLVHVPPDESRTVTPDGTISQVRAGPGHAVVGAGATATLEPVTIPFAATAEVRETWIEIVRHPEHELVAVVEVLSPDNKRGEGCDRYDAKRVDFVGGRVHLIEIDLLVGGRRLPMRRPLPPAHYYALVADAARRPDCEVYGWTVRDRLPPVPVPLAAPDQPVALDLAEAYSLTYERMRYAEELDYSTAPAGPWSVADLAWITQRARDAFDSRHQGG